MLASYILGLIRRLLNYYDIYKSLPREELIVALILYVFVKYTIMCSLLELIWPTQYFNKKHILGTTVNRVRTLVEYILKLVKNSKKHRQYFKASMQALSA